MDERKPNGKRTLLEKFRGVKAKRIRTIKDFENPCRRKVERKDKKEARQL